MLYREKSISVGTVGCEGGGLPNGQDLVPVPDVGFNVCCKFYGKIWLWVIHAHMHAN